MKSKMVKCKVCGAEIAKNAKACPHCGAKMHQGAYTACGLILVVTIFAVFAIIGNAFGSDGTSATKSGSADTTTPIEVSAQDLWGAYSDNEVNADNQYKDKTLAVTGTIVDISKSLVLDDPCVALKSGDQLGIYPVQCFFTDESENEQLATLEDGQTITITGTCAGKPVAHIQLSDCYLLN